MRRRSARVTRDVKEECEMGMMRSTLMGSVVASVIGIGAADVLANRACCFPDGSCISVLTIAEAQELCYPFGGVIQASGVVCS